MEKGKSLPLKFDFGDTVYVVNKKDNILEIAKGMIAGVRASISGAIQQSVDYTFTVRFGYSDYHSYSPDELLTLEEMKEKVRDFYNEMPMIWQD